jgi:hypothetical protein
MTFLRWRTAATKTATGRNRIAKDELKRQARWTESLAVGSQRFVEMIDARVRNRQKTETCEEGNAWILRETHGALIDVKNGSISASNPIIDS